ncbi:MAG: MBL fold metallo-hydrolase [Spirochaetaceae bacterium]|jgi:glyoxylase-like metal-dependent hydrolase (beta-lactamase superfamily II)|nr:MBL fold metallo-hydrolase [Spirochaetaceae bacterium]
MKRKIILGIVCGVAAINGFAADEAIFTCRVGDFTVHLLVENQGQGNPSILLGASEYALNRYIPGGTYRSEVNTVLVRGPDRILLIDTGFGGRIFDHLKTLGVDPGQVDAVILTHMHGDHIGGLQKGGNALFPRASVYLAQQEKAYWTETAANHGAVAALAPYGSRVHTFLPKAVGAGEELFPGIRAIAAFGHTPGHTIYQVESNGQKLLVWGDLMHVEDIQFPLPAVSVSYDTDPQAAGIVRKQILDYAAQNRIPIAGMHLRYPAVGGVTADGTGYRFSPLN